MHGETKWDLVEIIKKLCEMKQVELIEDGICKDHIHMYVAIPPQMSVSEIYVLSKRKKFIDDIWLTSGISAKVGR